LGAGDHLITGLSGWRERRAALVIAHPGHELRVHGWLEIAKPVVFVLTDGSGRSEQSRLESTSRILAATGAGQGAIYGRFTDAELYTAIRRGDAPQLADLVRELADDLVRHRIEYVVGDAREGFNPSHDLCRLVINTAVGLIAAGATNPIANFDVVLDGSPLECGDHLRDRAILIDLDEGALARKLSAALAYVGLQDEARSALERFGPQAFRVELLRPVLDCREVLGHLDEEPPHYERVGEQRVRDGFYDDVIRYHEHMRPLITALWSHAGLKVSSGGTTRTTASSPAPLASSHLTSS
jgi:AcrR family transcriptional regulator